MGVHFTRRLVEVEGVEWQNRIPVQWPKYPVPCLVRPRFADGYEGESEGEIVAWSPAAFEVRFSHPDPTVPPTLYKVWLPAGRVQPLPDVVGVVWTPEAAEGAS